MSDRTTGLTKWYAGRSVLPCKCADLALCWQNHRLKRLEGELQRMYKEIPEEIEQRTAALTKQLRDFQVALPNAIAACLGG